MNIILLSTKSFIYAYHKSSPAWKVPPPPYKLNILCLKYKLWKEYE